MKKRITYNETIYRTCIYCLGDYVKKTNVTDCQHKMK